MNITPLQFKTSILNANRATFMIIIADHKS